MVVVAPSILHRGVVRACIGLLVMNICYFQSVGELAEFN